MMENGKRKRGISLIRQVRQEAEASSEPETNLIAEKVHETPVVTTRFSYNRYPTGQPLSRHASAPKPKVNFAYPINYEAESSFIRNSSYNSHISQQPREQPQPKQVSFMYSQQTLGESETFTVERYPSFEQCKQSIGRKLFGGSRTYLTENYSISERSNKYVQSEKESEPKATERVPLEECKEKRKNLQIQREVFSFKPEPVAKPVVKTREICVSTDEQIKVSAKQNITPPLPALKTEPKKKNLNPLKLKEMQQRLLEIIKICDENM